MKQIPTKIIFLLIFAHFTFNLSAQNWQWADVARGTNSNSFAPTNFVANCRVEIDSQGNAYFLGMLGGNAGSVQFGNFTLTNNDNFPKAFLVKYSPCGIVLWAKIVNGNNFFYNNVIHIDIFDNIYISSYYNVVTKFNTDGTLIWEKEAAYQLIDIDSDSEGNLYVIGGLSYGFVSFGTQTYNTGWAWDFLVKYDNNFEFQWVRFFENEKAVAGFYNFNYGMCLDIDKSDNICVTYSFFGTIKIGEDTTFTAIDGLSSIIAKFQEDGSLTWVTEIDSGGSNPHIYDMNTDDNGNIYARVLYLNDDLGHPDSIHILKTDTNGAEVWKKRFNGLVDKENYYSSAIYFRPVKGITNSQNYLYIGSNYLLDSLNFIKEGIYLTAMDFDGNILFTKSGGNANTYLGGLSIFGNDNLYFTGLLSNQAQFDDITLNEGNFANFYAAKLKIIEGVGKKDITFCAGEQVQIGNPPVNGYTYQWTPTNGLSNPNISNPTISLTHTENDTVSYQYILTVTDNSCPNRPLAIHDTVKVNVLPAYNDLKIFTGSTTVCPFVGGVKYWLNKNENYNFVWEVSGGTIESGQSSDTIRVFWANPNSNAWVKITASHKTSLCPKTITLPIIVDEILKPDTPSGENQLCLDETKIFTYQTSLLNNGSSYQWQTDDATAIIEGISTQSELHIRWLNAGIKKLWVVEINQTPCIGSSDTLIIEVYPKPAPLEIQGLKKVPVFASQVPYRVENKMGSVYQWILSSGGEITAGQGTHQIFIDWLEEGEFVLTVQETDANGCMGKPYTLNIEVIPFIPPNVITPNNDQLNDEWVLDEIEFFPENEIKIFNRWGKLVFESKNYQNNWQADTSDNGVYFYQIYLHPKLNIVKGWIKVMK